MVAQKLSILMPCFNEVATLHEAAKRIFQTKVPDIDYELIIIDDASEDDSYEIALEIKTEFEHVKVLQHLVNQGKGAALRTGMQAASGDIVLIHDADLEYDAAEYPILLNPILSNKADVVYGSRFIGGETRRILYYWHSLGNQFLTHLSNAFTNLNLSDMETCFKVFRKDVLDQITVQENRFGFEPEITAKIARLRPHIRIYEVGISYTGRTYEEGKKISWRDGFWAIICILRYNLFR
jgi:glycosyltransferase involved in cell wall biosynthesis